MSMTIGELLDILAPLNPYKEVIFDFGYLAPTVVNSWRGSYNEPALGYGVYGYSSSPTGFRPPTVGVLVEELKGAISGVCYTGWKGGEYQYYRSSPLHIDNPGDYSCTELVGVDVQDCQVTLLTERREGDGS